MKNNRIENKTKNRKKSDRMNNENENNKMKNGKDSERRESFFLLFVLNQLQIETLRYQRKEVTELITPMEGE